MLYVISTPIGNLGDISLRALEVLRDADLVVAENPAHSAKLLNHYQIKKPYKKFADHNEQVVLPELEEIIKTKKVCLLTDAGTPSVSDPGFRLVRACIEWGVAVDFLPGPCAAIAGLVLSGLPTDKFLFVGFLPKSEIKVCRAVELIEVTDSTLIAYESPERLSKTLGYIATKYPEYNVAICRELTKLHQAIYRGTIKEAYSETKNKKIKGEIVLVISKKS